MSLVWKGKQVAANVHAATLAAVDETTQAAADDARGSHWWGSRSGNLEAEIVNEAATDKGGHISGRFGTTQHAGFYGLFLERSTPFLRPAGDREFPQLARRIREKLK